MRIKPAIKFSALDSPLAADLESRYLASLGHRVDGFLGEFQERSGFFDGQNLIGHGVTAL
jgi:hypothetical protein